MDYSGLIKRLDVPEGFAMPRELAHGEVVATVLGREDLDDDVRGINASLDLIRRTRGGGWPTEPVTAEYNYTDLVWHEAEFREGYSYSYVVRDRDGAYLGCAYLYPMGRRTTLSEDLLVHDVDVSWFVTTDAYAKGLYAELYRALQHWLDNDLPFERPYFSNAEIPD
jgi:hypothetical protein